MKPQVAEVSAFADRVDRYLTGGALAPMAPRPELRGRAVRQDYGMKRAFCATGNTAARMGSASAKGKNEACEGPSSETKTGDSECVHAHLV